MVWILRLEKVIFWLFYVIPYLLIVFLLILSQGSIAINDYSLSFSLNEVFSELYSTQNQRLNIFSILYDIAMFIFFLLGLLGIYSYLYKKAFFSKKIWIFIALIVFIDSIGETFYSYEDFLIFVLMLIYLSYYLFTLYRLIRSYDE